ncbi:Gamma-aminobutyric acid type B receptor subunit 2, partial [Trichoplax sp. H2]
MKLKIIIFLLLYISIESFCESDKIDLYIGGFFPIDNVGWNGSGLVPASQMAIDDINSRDDILPNYRLNLIVGNTKASATLGVKVLFDFIHLPPKKIMLLGSGFSRVTSAIAGVAKYYNLIQTTFSSESALLSDKSEYPFLFRTCFSVNAWNIPQVALVKHFNWTRVATLTRRSDLYDASTERLLSELYRAKVEVVAKEGFISGTNSSRQIRNLKKNDARIIIAHLQEEDAIEVFCQAYKYQMYGPNYAWIVPGFLSRTFWSKATKLEHVDCTPEEIAISANYSLSISFATMNVVTSETISGMTPNNFNIRYNNWPTIVNQTYYPNSYAAFAYDSIWAEAMAMNNSIKRLAELNRTLEDFHYGDREMSRILKEEMYNLNFSGIS